MPDKQKHPDNLGFLLSENLSTQDPGDCISPDAMAALTENRLPRAQMEAAYAHIAVCETCRQTFRLTRDLLDDPEQPEMKAMSRRALALAASAIIVVISLYLLLKPTLFEDPAAKARPEPSPRAVLEDKTFVDRMENVAESPAAGTVDTGADRETDGDSAGSGEGEKPGRQNKDTADDVTDERVPGTQTALELPYPPAAEVTPEIQEETADIQQQPQSAREAEKEELRAAATGKEKAMEQRIIRSRAKKGGIPAQRAVVRRHPDGEEKLVEYFVSEDDERRLIRREHLDGSGRVIRREDLISEMDIHYGYHENGMRRWRKVYRRGKPAGRWTWWDETGKVIRVRSFDPQKEPEENERK